MCVGPLDELCISSTFSGYFKFVNPAAQQEKKFVCQHSQLIRGDCSGRKNFSLLEKNSSSPLDFRVAFSSVSFKSLLSRLTSGKDFETVRHTDQVLLTETPKHPFESFQISFIPVSFSKMFLRYLPDGLRNTCPTSLNWTNKF